MICHQKGEMNPQWQEGYYKIGASNGPVWRRHSPRLAPPFDTFGAAKLPKREFR
jgi:hypothetical protein